MKRRPSTKQRWADHYTLRAKKENYPARSVYKLKEIQHRFRIIKPGDCVLDLGCAPGAWLRFAAETTQRHGRVIGIDIKPITLALPPNVTTMVADIRHLDDHMTAMIGNRVNVVICDAAPATSGQKDVDAARSFDLCRAALDIAVVHLMPGGHFVCKIFQGEDSGRLIESVKSAFRKTKLFKPQSSRKSSKEIYAVAMGKR